MRTLRAFLSTVAILVLIGAMCCLFFISRGFRANSVPGRVESRVARSLRDFAIPGSESRRKNPLAVNSDDLSQGREAFVAHCVACHGIDGSGKTQIGVNLYPRVPDLRSADTQGLSDGQIHYIIENGVQLTGMPAWGNPHSEASGDSWKLVLFVRSLGRPTDRGKSKTVSEAHYVGSQACEKCHAEIYRRWKKTPMANVVRDPREHPEAILPDLTTNDVARFSKDQVALVYGSVWKQRYFTRVGGDYFPLPVQWDVATHAWLPYNVPRKGADWWTAFYPPDNMQRPTSSTCDGCHSVDYDTQTKQVAEWNVGCERCHGPGSEHVSHPSRGNIVNPAQMDSAAADNVCIQCHSQGRPPSGAIAGKYYDWPVGYRVGLKLEDFWKLEDCTLGQTTFYYFPDCTAHKNRMQGNDFVQSVMYRHGITCASCHDVHGTENYAQLRKPASQICLDCHGPSSPNGPREATVAEHTHHKDGSAGSECVACHMPKIESEGVPGALVHAHTFRVITPGMTEKYNIPNACNGCHSDRSTAWAIQAMKGWGMRAEGAPEF